MRWLVVARVGFTLVPIKTGTFCASSAACARHFMFQWMWNEAKWSAAFLSSIACNNPRIQLLHATRPNLCEALAYTIAY